MFMTIADLDRDGADDALVALSPGPLLLLRRQGPRSANWRPIEIPMPEGTGTGKGVAVGDVDGDGVPDVVFSCEHANGEKSGLMWLSCEGSPLDGKWHAHHLSGPAGIKFDRIELLDLDGDADLDVLTCEESQPVEGKRRGLGVVWYENPGH
jgi:hypothetical protein